LRAICDIKEYIDSKVYKNMSTSSKKSQKTIRRKIQIVGGNTITVSLPRTWVKMNRLGKGEGEEQEIAMRQHLDGSLILSPANLYRTQVERKRVHRIKPDTDADELKRILLADFIGGVDVIRLVLKKPLPAKVEHELQDFVDKRLIGFDMIDLDKSIEVINMTQAPKFEVDRLMEIIRVHSTRMVANCYKWIKDLEVEPDELYAKMSDWEVILDRQSNQMMRTLQLSLLDFWMAERVNLPMAEILYWSTVNKAAESAGDLAFAIASLAPILRPIQIDNRVKSDLHTLGNQSSKLFSKAMKAFISADSEASYLVLQEQAKSSTTIQQKWPIQSVEGLSSNATVMLRHLDKIGTYARKIAEATIDREAARVAYTLNQP
jgi:phosphate uptake regulator